MSVVFWFALIFTPLSFVLKMFNIVSLLIFVEMLNLCCFFMFDYLMLINMNFLLYLVLIFAMDSLILIFLLILSLGFCSKDYNFLIF